MPAGLTYEPIQTIVLSDPQSSVVFGGIPQTFTDLRLVMNYYANPQGATQMQLNQLGAGYYANTGLYLTGGSTLQPISRTTSNSDVGMYINGFTNTSSAGWCQTTVDIMNYKSTSMQKGVIYVSNNNQATSTGTSGMEYGGGFVNFSTATTSIIVFNDGGNTFVANSSFTLYGIAAA